MGDGHEFTEDVHRQHCKMYEDFYLGRDAENPPITMRVDRLERTVTMTSKVVWAIFVAVLACSGEGIAILLTKH